MMVRLDTAVSKAENMRVTILAAGLLLSGCAAGLSAEPVIPSANLDVLLLGADLNVTDPAVNRKISLGPVADASFNDCILVVTPANPPSRALEINFGQLTFLYEDEDDDSIGMVQRGRGQPAISFFTDPTRYAETLRGFEVAAESCGSRPDRSEPLVSWPG